MAQATGRGRVLGDYLVGRQIGSGSFSTVWYARHRFHGTEVAIKENITSRLNKKLQDKIAVGTAKGLSYLHEECLEAEVGTPL